MPLTILPEELIILAIFLPMFQLFITLFVDLATEGYTNYKWMNQPCLSLVRRLGQLSAKDCGDTVTEESSTPRFLIQMNQTMVTDWQGF